MHNNIFPNAKPNPYQRNVKDIRDKIRECKGKTKFYADGYRLDKGTIEDISRQFNNDTRESASQALNPRSAVLHRIQKYGIIPAKYTLSPRKKREIRPAGQA